MTGVSETGIRRIPGTAYNYQSGGRIATVVRAGLTNVTERYLDGRIKCTRQNGDISSWYQYGVNTNDNTQWTTTYTGPDGANSPMLTKTVTDMLGRTVRTEKPGFDGTVLANMYSYNAEGNLCSSVVPSPMQPCTSTIRSATRSGPASMSMVTVRSTKENLTG